MCVYIYIRGRGGIVGFVQCRDGRGRARGD
jgi:hypothetical protein